MISIVLHYGTAALFVLLGVWVLSARPSGTVNRVLGLTLLLLAGSTVAFYRLQQATSPAEALTFQRFVNWYELPLVLLVTLLADALFVRRRNSRARRAVLAAVGAGTVLLLVLHGIAPEMFHRIGTPGGLAADAARSRVVPLAPAIGYGLAFTVAKAGVIVLAARAAVEATRTGAQRRRAALVGLAFGALIAHSGAHALAGRLLDDPAGMLHPWIGPTTALDIAALGALAWAVPRLSAPFGRRARAAVLVLPVAAFAVGSYEVGLAGLIDPAPRLWGLGTSRPVWIAAFAVTLALAVVRYGLAGGEDASRARRVQATGVLAILALAGAGAATVLASMGVSTLSLVAAVGVVGATAALPLTPLRRLPGAVVEALVVDPDEPQRVRERVQVYRRSLEAATGPDGTVAPEDEPVLAALREELGFTERDHRMIASTLDADPGEASPEPDVVLGRYFVQGEVASGGSGVLYRARDSVLGREVALKRLPAGGEAPGEGVEEARAIARVDHPNVVRVHDVQRDGSSVWLVLELVEGTTLADRLREHGALAPHRAVEVALAVLDGLAAVHAAGLVHGDVSAANVIQAPDGPVKLADFGTATARAPDPDETAARPARRATPSAMAPEHVTGDGLEAATDVYAVGALLHRMLTGEDPLDLEGLTSAEVRSRVLAGVEVDTADVPAALAPVLERATARRPGDRFEDAEAFREALAAAAGATDGAVDPLTPP